MSCRESKLDGISLKYDLGVSPILQISSIAVSPLATDVRGNRRPREFDFLRAPRLSARIDTNVHNPCVCAAANARERLRVRIGKLLGIGREVTRLRKERSARCGIAPPSMPEVFRIK